MLAYFISSYPTRGCGISRYTERLIEALGREGIGTASCRVFFLRERFRHLCDWSAGIREISRTRPEIIHVQYTPTICGPLTPLFLTWMRCRCRYASIVLTAHEKPSIYSRHLGRAAGLLFRLYEMTTYALAHRVLVHTDEHRRELTSGFKVKPGKLDMVPIGISEGVEVSEERIEQFRRAYDLGSRTIITFFGLIRPLKGLEYLLEAMSIVLEEDQDLVLVIGGEAPREQAGYLENLREMVGELSIGGHVVFTGYVEEEQLPEILQSSQLLVLPYTGATQSAVLHEEVIAYEKPVVVTDVGGLGELVRRHEIGMVVPPADPTALAKAILDLLADEGLRSSFIGKQRQMKLSWGWEGIAREHIAAYRRAAG